MENTLKVFVLNMRGQPLMPCSPPKARKLLRAGKAVPVRRTPFVIQLTVPTGETKQPITLGVDAGYKHVGLSATTAKEELLASEVELRQDVTGLLSDRLALRRARRNRKTRRPSGFPTFKAQSQDTLPRTTLRQPRSIEAQGLACAVRGEPHSGAHIAH